MDADTLVQLLNDHHLSDWAVKFDGTILDPDGTEWTQDEVIAGIAKTKNRLEKLQQLLDWAKTCPGVGD
jgi:hypothetical protein